MGDVSMITPSADAAGSLRRIADEIDSGVYSANDWTVVGAGRVFHFGQVSDERAAEGAVFNMTFGIHKLMQAAVRED